jgi:F-type H+-transporting ATPase subunit gamma
MAQIRQIRTRIASVKNIQHITRAMKLVASARLHRAQTQLLDARPYAFKLKEVVREIASRVGADLHPLLRENRAEKSALVVLTSDKGLCGGFNAKPLQAAGRALQTEEPARRPEIVAVGRKGLNFFRRVGVKSYREWSGFWQDLAWLHADQMGEELIDAYLAGRWAKVTLVYNRFKSTATQELVQETILPIRLESPTPPTGKGVYLFEPSADTILEFLLPRFVKNALWHALLESKAAELAARMQAMESASRNAGDMIQDLTLHMNRARQSSITREISEIVGAAEAVQG